MGADRFITLSALICHIPALHSTDGIPSTTNVASTSWFVAFHAALFDKVLFSLIKGDDSAAVPVLVQLQVPSAGNDPSEPGCPRGVVPERHELDVCARNPFEVATINFAG